MDGAMRCSFDEAEEVPPFVEGSVYTFSNHGLEESSTGALEKINQDRGSIEYPVAEHPQQALFCVFDGHGKDGEHVSGAATGMMHASVVAYQELEADPMGALRVSFRVVEEMLETTPDFDVEHSGTTAVVALLRDRDLYLAHVGDSRAVLGRRPAGADTLLAVQLTADHVPGSQSEADAVRARGGQCVPEFAGWPPRVVLFEEGRMHSTMMTRSLGDLMFKRRGGLTAEPELNHYQIESEDEFLVIASDGVWEVLTNQEVVDMVASCDNAADACEKVIAAATQKWSEQDGNYRDDITATGIFFPCFPPLDEELQHIIGDSPCSPPMFNSPFLGGRPGSLSLRNIYIDEPCSPHPMRRKSLDLEANFLNESAFGVLSESADAFRSQISDSTGSSPVNAVKATSVTSPPFGMSPSDTHFFLGEAESSRDVAAPVGEKWARTHSRRKPQKSYAANAVVDEGVHVDGVHVVQAEDASKEKKEIIQFEFAEAPPNEARGQPSGLGKASTEATSSASKTLSTAERKKQFQKDHTGEKRRSSLLLAHHTPPVYRSKGDSPREHSASSHAKLRAEMSKTA